MGMPEAEFQTLRCDRVGAIATITLHRPEVLNALNAAVFDDLELAFDHFANDAEVRVILLTGAGERAFAAGADIRELAHADERSGTAVAQRGKAVLAGIEGCGKPVIACLNGIALGGGCELALACTMRLAADRAVLGLPEARLGLIPGYGGTQRLLRLVGRSAALRLMLTAEPVDAAEALRLGLVDAVVPAAELMVRARAVAEAISRLAPLAVAGVLEAVRRGGVLPLEQALVVETEIFGRLCGTADKREGIAAFLEKRPANWQRR